MRDQRIVTVAAGVLAATSLVLTGCGGGSSSDNTAVVDQLMQEIGDEGIDETARSCIRDSLMGYTAEDLDLLANGKSDADISPELQEKVVNMMMTCLGDTN